MKNNNFILTVLLLIAGLVITGFCMNIKAQNIQDNGKLANKDMQDGKNGFDREWQQFKSDAESIINDNEERIADFKVTIKTTGKESKPKYEKVVTMLSQKISGLKKRISEYKFDGNDKLEEFKLEFNHDMDIVDKALE
jgi:uncharacterized protein HemX